MPKPLYDGDEFVEDEDEEEELPEEDDEIIVLPEEVADFTPNEIIDKLLADGCEHVMVSGFWMHELRSGIYGLAVRYNGVPYNTDNKKSFREAYDDFVKENLK